MKWGMEKAEKEGLDLYLDATTGELRPSYILLEAILIAPSHEIAGYPVYKKYGFVEIGKKLLSPDGSFEVRSLRLGVSFLRRFGTDDFSLQLIPMVLRATSPVSMKSS